MVPVLYNESEAIISPFDSTQDDLSDKDLVAQLGVILAAISLLSSLLVMASYIKFTRLRSFAFELILMVAISDFFRDCSFILTPSLDPNLCLPQAVLMSLGETSSIFWVFSIAFTIHRTILREDCWAVGTQRWKYHVACWGLSILLTLLPFITHDYDKCDKFWCWIKYTSTWGLIMGFICYYGPVWLIVSYLIWVYSKVWRMLAARPVCSRDSRRLKHRFITQKRMAIYPTIFLFAIIFPSIDRVYLMITHRRSNYLAMLHIISSCLQGLLNSFVYGFTTAVRLEWIAYCCPNREVKDRYVSFIEEYNRSSTSRLDFSHTWKDNMISDNQPASKSNNNQ